MNRPSSVDRCVLCAGLLWAVTWVILGCRPATQVANSPPPVDELLASLAINHNLIRDAYEQGNPEAAHDALHDVAQILDALGKLSAESGLSLGQREQIKAGVATMVTAYAQLDEAAHGGETVDYSAVADDLKGALENMQQALSN